MIKKVTIKNFQSHHDTEIEFGEGVNVMVGSSDCGKSAIIRAIRWVLQNTPDGTDFITHGKKKTEVSVEFDNCVVRRVRSASVNAYYLNDQEFKAFGRNTVPDEILEALNLSDLCWQAQLDGPFLLSETSGEVARYLNRVTNLTIIDDCLAEASSQKKAIVSRMKYADEEILEKARAIDALGDLDALERPFKQLNILYTKQEETLKEYDALADHIEAILRVVDQQEYCVFSVDAVKHVEACLELYQEADSLKAEMTGVQRVLQDLDDIEHDLTFLAECPPVATLEPVQVLIDELKAVEEEAKALRFHIKQTNNIILACEQSKERAEQRKQTFHDNFPDVCPLCGAEQ